jgi:hypothetical protein
VQANQREREGGESRAVRERPRRRGVMRKIDGGRR